MVKLNVPRLDRNTRLPERLRVKVGRQLLQAYNEGTSIREICSETGYSIGRVRRLLDEVGVQYRTRGGRRTGSRV